MSHISYPEARMDVAVLVDDSTVRVYGWEDHGFRKLIRTMHCPSHAQALTYVNNFNTSQKQALAVRPSH